MWGNEFRPSESGNTPGDKQRLRKLIVLTSRERPFLYEAVDRDKSTAGDSCLTFGVRVSARETTLIVNA